MLGKVVSFNLSTGRGKIVLKDGNEVVFVRDEWKLPIRPQVNILVEYMRGDIVMPVQTTFEAKQKPVTPVAPQKQLSDTDVNKIMNSMETPTKKSVKKVIPNVQKATRTTSVEEKSVKVTAQMKRSAKKQEQLIATSPEKTETTPILNATTPEIVRSAKGHIETMKEKAAKAVLMEEMKKNGCKAEAYIEKKLEEGYKLIEKDEQHFTLVQKHVNRGIINRAQRWLLYTIPLFLSFIIFADDMSMARCILDTLLQINVILLLGTLSTLYWQGYVSEAFKVQVTGSCDFDKLVVDESQEIEFYQTRAA